MTRVGTMFEGCETGLCGACAPGSCTGKCVEPTSRNMVLADITTQADIYRQCYARERVRYVAPLDRHYHPGQEWAGRPKPGELEYLRLDRGPRDEGGARLKERF